MCVCITVYVCVFVFVDPDPGSDPELSEKPDPDPGSDPKKIIPDPQHWSKMVHSIGLPLIYSRWDFQKVGAGPILWEALNYSANFVLSFEINTKGGNSLQITL